ncbi:sugar transferase [Colwellia sp. BRX8-2]|uniref:sugar transferase n=2 Tax=Colwellia TaxID=28228 RepID=UPI0015F700D4|nr:MULTISPECIES: sugar transferase [unclassified Colwellia]MBA6350088.1 sugar transferase [Colwellia sp. BRX8-9]MBA6353935.1 sugar transferase [Colwellia sp. BRX9-1]MBA6362032.1 sugar transferase [Colwellia sp. BRX8-6]MBA6367035.1 sugar transferase [Colwellia sp. BRX8-5]MBA6371163.1 sugar transferase [Colwellia sp. BRX8-4]
MTIQILNKIKNQALLTKTRKAIVINYQHKGIPVILQQSIALLALILISPVLLIVMILIKTESLGGALFSQTRVGENGRHFKMYKFRSMYLKSDPHFKEPDPSQSSREGVCKKYINDPRITKIGQFIRKYSIDELPQLFNIVRGDMCLVGPRPALSIETYEYDNFIQPRLFTKPGLTGLWQVSGRADTNFEEQLQLDKSYIKQQSFLMDCKIIALTIPAVLMAKGAY